MSGEQELPALEAVALLRRLVDLLPPLSLDGEAAANAFARYLHEAPQDMPLDRAFGVNLTPIGVVLMPSWSGAKSPRPIACSCAVTV